MLDLAPHATKSNRIAIWAMYKYEAFTFSGARYVSVQVKPILAEDHLHGCADRGVGLK